MVTKKSLIIAVVVVFLLLIGIYIGITMSSSSADKNAGTDNISEKNNVSISKDDYTMQRDLSKYEKLAMEYLLEATSPNANTQKLMQLGGCEEDGCELVNNFYDVNDNITGKAPEFLSKAGTYYVGSDINNQVPEGESTQTLVYVLVPPKSMTSMEDKEPPNTYGHQYYPHSNLVVFNISLNNEGKYKLKNYDASSAADYDKYYEYNDFTNSEIGQQITTEANLNWRAVNVQSKTKYQ
ncbi:hypothetical protein [Shimazuella kribbensis]|uniref:hypothetical protein n=1 Tax=Shimazuella kribbensis TaxID=139808 RepID=UPI0003FCC86C|nr:hypothetical protein [Shimazuella kribbensis]